MGCSPIKVVRELGLKRRETVWSLSTMGVEELKVIPRLVREDWRLWLHKVIDVAI